MEELLAKIDALHTSGDHRSEYDELIKIFNTDQQNTNPEVLWRLARACDRLAKADGMKDARRKELILEGEKYALDAYSRDDNNFNVVKWTAVVTGDLTNHLGMKEKILKGHQFKGYLDKGLSIDPTEYSLLHMRGRFAFSVASLSWFERKAAATFFAEPPTATFDEAIEDFLRVEEVRPRQWVENILYLARSYLEKSDKANAVTWLNIGIAIQPADDADRIAFSELKALHQKHVK